VKEAIDDTLHERGIGYSTDGTPGEKRKSVEQKAEDKDQRAASQNLAADVALIRTPRSARAQ